MSIEQIVEQARKDVNECDNSALKDAINQGKLIIDVREPNEFDQDSIENAINIPRGLIEFSITSHPETKSYFKSTQPKDVDIYLYCRTGGRSALAAQSLKTLGFNRVYSLRDGFLKWQH